MSPSSSQKRKHTDTESLPSKKRKKHAHHDREQYKRHEFAQVEASLTVALPPVFATNAVQGVEEMLDSMLMRYIPPLRGVVLAHSNLRFLDSKAEIRGDSPFAACRVLFDATVWSPRVGHRLTGRITLSSPDHVALLVHNTFNAAIPAAYVPREEWEFVPGTTDDDEAMAEGEAADVGAGPENMPNTTTSPGHWVHVRTRNPLGGPERILSFNVIGLTIANQMLSVVGSILPDGSVTHSGINLAQEDASLLPEPSPRPNGGDNRLAPREHSADPEMRRSEKKNRKKETHQGEEHQKRKEKESSVRFKEGVDMFASHESTDPEIRPSEKKKRKKEKHQDEERMERKEKHKLKKVADG